MNELDIAFLLGTALAGFGGWRLGLVRRVAGWVGLLAGVLLASWLVPIVLPKPATPTPTDLVKSLALIAALGLAGQAIGHVVGGRVRRIIDVARLGVVDSVGGSVVGVIGVIVAAWMIVPAMVQIPGWPAETARGSVVAGRLTRALGDPPDVLAGVERSLGVDGITDALENVRNLTVDPVAPNGSPLSSETLQRVSASVVKLSGPACDRQQSGSGFVIAPGVVATNAHVVAGTEAISITNGDGLEVSGAVRYLDIRNDIALVAAPDLDRPALPLADAKEGDSGAVLGYPGGGPLKEQAYTVAAVTTATAKDIYDADRFSRDILILGSRIGPGDSGGPLVTADGSVVGIAFGIAPDDDQTAYAVPGALLEGLVDDMAGESIDPGRCRA